MSNETSYGVTRFCQLAEQHGLPRIVSIQNSYSLLVRTAFETDLAETCAQRQCNVGLLAYSPLAGESRGRSSGAVHGARNVIACPVTQPRHLPSRGKGAVCCCNGVFPVVHCKVPENGAPSAGGGLTGKYGGDKAPEGARFVIFPGAGLSEEHLCRLCRSAPAICCLHAVLAAAGCTQLTVGAVPWRQRVLARMQHAEFAGLKDVATTGAVAGRLHGALHQVAGQAGGRGVCEGGAEARHDRHGARAGLVQRRARPGSCCYA